MFWKQSILKKIFSRNEKWQPLKKSEKLNCCVKLLTAVEFIFLSPRLDFFLDWNSHFQHFFYFWKWNFHSTGTSLAEGLLISNKSELLTEKNWASAAPLFYLLIVWSYLAFINTHQSSIILRGAFPCHKWFGHLPILFFVWPFVIRWVAVGFFSILYLYCFSKRYRFLPFTFIWATYIFCLDASFLFLFLSPSLSLSLSLSINLSLSC